MARVMVEGVAELKNCQVELLLTCRLPVPPRMVLVSMPKVPSLSTILPLPLTVVLTRVNCMFPFLTSVKLPRSRVASFTPPTAAARMS